MNQNSVQPILKVENLSTSFQTEEGTILAVDGVSFDIYPNEILGIVGESGSGKSVTALSILRLIPEPTGKITSGNVYLNNLNLMQLDYSGIRKIRGREIGMIFQEPMTSLNPVFPIGKQVMEPLIYHKKYSQEQAIAESVKVLEQVGIPDAKKRLWDYPHQFSGGMRQRVMIAMALICKPILLIADEPTTALDVTIQAQILDLMKKIQKERTRSSILLITHDLSVIAETCHRVIVMYGGKIQEIAPVNLLFRKPLHPYTKGLLRSIPSVKNKGLKLQTIVGNVPSFQNFPKGCRFADRCPEVVDDCHTIEPNLKQMQSEQWVRCHLADEGMK
tara:strand:- start:49 stop:1044 length:996 start_codon:yes stop_codon:yes gene_type:complete